MNVQNAPQVDAKATPFRGGAAPGYMSGFGNSFETEALAGALPVGRNSPQQVDYGLYAEQLSGSPFTAPQATNQRSWLYRIRPAVKHSGRFRMIDKGLIRTAPAARDESNLPIGQLRWSPVPIPAEPLTFVTGLRTVTTAGDAETRAGMAAHLLFVTNSMRNEYFFNADGELLIVPQNGQAALLHRVRRHRRRAGRDLRDPARRHLPGRARSTARRAPMSARTTAAPSLPDRGPIGANCLANARDFLTPVAAYEDKEEPSTLYVKWGGELYAAEIDQSPLDVVAWHGNYAPYKYDLRRFSPVGALLFDHPDPSIFTVMTAPSETPGTANVDFVIFPERWAVAENTFRPPWYHRNLMSEFMGLIYGIYDAKPEGFVPGGMSLHNCMLPHGPDEQAFEHASAAELKPAKLDQHHGVHVRDPVPAAPDRLCGRARTSGRTTTRLLARPAQAFQPGTAVIGPSPSAARIAMT